MSFRAWTCSGVRALPLLVLALAGGCGVQVDDLRPAATPAEPDGGSQPDAGMEPVEPSPTLYGAPLLFAPTAHGFGLSVVTATGDPAKLGAHVRKRGETEWSSVEQPVVRAADVAEWTIDGLSASASYEYEVGVVEGGELDVLYSGSVTTARDAGQAFSFALVSDTHIGSHLEVSNQGDETVLTRAGLQIAAAAPDFVVNLGDMLDFHEYGFNVPPLDSSITRLAYVNYRGAFGDVLGHVPHFPVIGGWDSENGCNSLEEIERSRSQRLLYLPGPRPDTYPAAGSPFEDYYAFTWGDALFVMLNVFSYSPTCHRLEYDPGAPDDWTLGDAQLEFLRTTLENATSRWRFLLIHHPVGGNAGTVIDSAYGRGGGRAAHVGEQEIVHELMQEHGVQVFFYGHDHVFTDMTVDATHYTLPGSAGSIWPFPDSQTGYEESWADSGWARVDVSPDSVHVAFLGLDDALLHEYTLE